MGQVHCAQDTVYKMQVSSVFLEAFYKQLGAMGQVHCAQDTVYKMQVSSVFLDFNAVGT